MGTPQLYKAKSAWRKSLVKSALLPENSSPANTRPTTSNSPLARIATRSSAAPSLKSLIKRLSVKFPCSFGSGNFIPDPEKKFPPRWLHRGSALPKNHIIQYKCHFYSLFLLDFPTILSKIILLKKKTKKLSKMFSWTEQNH